MRHAALLRSRGEDKPPSMIWVLGCWSFSVAGRGINSFIILINYFIIVCNIFRKFSKGNKYPFEVFRERGISFCNKNSRIQYQ